MLRPPAQACPKPSVGLAPWASTSPPAGGFEMGLAGQANFAYDSCGKQNRWRQLRASMELTKAMKATWAALSTGNPGGILARAKPVSGH